MTAADIRRCAIQELQEMLSPLGFRKRAGAIFTAQVSPDVLGWLGLNTAHVSARKELEVVPIVGIRHQGIERLVAECQAIAFHAYVPPTLTTPLGYLMPKKGYSPWFFTTDGIEETAQQLTDAVRYYGMPFIESGRTLDALVDIMDRMSDTGHRLEYVRPVALFLAGRPGEAAHALNCEVRRVGSRRDEAAERFRGFAGCLAGRIDAAG